MATHPVSKTVPASAGAPAFSKPPPSFKCVCLPEPGFAFQPSPPFQAFTNCRNRPTVTSYLSRRKVLTVAGSASPAGPASGTTNTKLSCGDSSYVRKKVPPSTSKVVQQLSLFGLEPQSVTPASPVAQRGFQRGAPLASAPASRASLSGLKSSPRMSLQASSGAPSMNPTIQVDIMRVARESAMTETQNDAKTSRPLV